LLVPFVKYLWRTHAPNGQSRPAALGLFLLASAWTLVFFSIGGSKRAGYILPALPPLALALGCFLEAALSRWALSWAALTRRVLVLRWALGAAATFILLLALVNWSLPVYARRFALRHQVLSFARQGTAPEVAVVCYPRMWDSVSFYLRRSNVNVYTADQRQRFIDDLRSRSRSLVFIKADQSFDLLRELPSSLEVVERRRGEFAVAWIRRRGEPPATAYAKR
jgi:hypothetical protein